MKTRLVAFILLTELIFSLRSFAIDQGTASGTLKIDNETVTLTHAYAHLHDNAEGWLDNKKEMRILISDREIPQEALSGLNLFFNISSMVKQGLVRGVMIRFDPAKPASVQMTALHSPIDTRYSLPNKTISDSENHPLKNLSISEMRVSATVIQSNEGNADLGWPSENFRFKFSAPLFKEPPVTATLKNKQALKSPQVKVILGRAAALIKGDLEKARQYSTERYNRYVENLMLQSQEDVKNMMRENGKVIEQSLTKGTLRLVVRGDSATLIVKAKDGKTMFGLIRKNGDWLVD